MVYKLHSSSKDDTAVLLSTLPTVSGVRMGLMRFWEVKVGLSYYSE